MLKVENLWVTFETKHASIQAVRGVSFEIAKGETLAIVGESGCGKSVTCHAIMGLNPPKFTKTSEKSIFYEGEDIANSRRDIQGNKISMIFQDPLTALNPTMRVGDQLVEGIKHHKKISNFEAKKRALDLIERVGLDRVEERFRQFPHEFSGGMLQRIVIAMALMCDPALLIADEPTTALDVTIQLKILRLIKSLQKQLNMGLLIVTHDLGVVSAVADRMLVMYAGQVVESGLVEDILTKPQHPYTQALLASMPSLAENVEQLHAIEGQPPDLALPPKGCAFYERCQVSISKCLSEEPPSYKLGNNLVKCWLKDERVGCNVD